MTRSLLGAFALFCLITSPAPAQAQDGDPLLRRAYLGVSVEDPKAGVIRNTGGAATDGIQIASVSREGSAAPVGMTKGTLITAINGIPITNVPQFLREIAVLHEGDTAVFTVWGTGQLESVTVPLLGYPRETGDGFEVLYEAFEHDGVSVRRTVTQPRGEGPFPTVFLLPDVGCSALENGHTSRHRERDLAHALTQRGYRTVRVDRPGAGDSEGGPCSDLGLDAEIALYHAALKATRNRSAVDRGRLFLLTFGWGAAYAPDVAHDVDLAGILALGPLVDIWREATVDERARALATSTKSESDQAQELERYRFFLDRMLDGNEPADQVLDSYPELKRDFPDPETLKDGKSREFYRDLESRDLLAGWGSVRIPVLAVHGEADYVASAEQSERVAETVNAAYAGAAQFTSLEKTDYWLNRASSQRSSVKQGLRRGMMNLMAVDALVAWMEETAGTSE